MTEEQNTPESTTEPAEGAPAKPPGLQNVDEEKLAKIRETIAKYVSSDKKTISGSEAPVDSAEQNVGSVTQGKDVDWSEYELPANSRHLYPRAEHRETSQGPKWVVFVDEFYSDELNWRSHDKKSAAGESVNFGEWLNDHMNGPEGWQIASILPGSLGKVGVLLTRKVPVALPDPVLLKKETEVEAPGDPELQQVEDAALKFAEDIAMKPDAPEALTSLERAALELNAPTERDPGPLGSAQPAGEAPEGLGAEAAAALAGEDFEKKVTDEGHVGA